MIGLTDACLPLTMPEPCPVCGKQVLLTAVTEWETESRKIIGAEYECETEPDIESDEWWDWHRCHYYMPYVDWLPWENRALVWLNRNYRYQETAPSVDVQNSDRRDDSLASGK